MTAPRPLTPQEMVVLELVWSGLQLKEVAVVMQLETKTVMNYRTAIYRKLGVHCVQQALRRGLELGLLRLPPVEGWPR